MEPSTVEGSVSPAPLSGPNERRVGLTARSRAITVIKGNEPLSLRYSRKHRAVLYASEPEYIEDALDDLRGWRELEIPPLTMLTFRHETLKEWQSHPFKFVCQERKGTLPEGVKA